METISHREMRNHSSEVLRAVASGDSFTITNDGVAVAKLIPVGSDKRPRVARPAKTQGGFSSLKRYPSEESVAEMLDDLRGER